MRLMIRITGPKVHDVGYRYFLMSMAMSNRIKMFEAHNIESNDGDEVLVLVDGDDKKVEAFRSLVKTKRLARSEVSNIVFDDFEGEIMKIGEYAQFCSTVQLNKAIPVLLDIRDDLKEMKGDMKAVRKTAEATLDETKEIHKTTDATLEEIKSVRKTAEATLDETKEIHKTTDATLEEIKSVRKTAEATLEVTKEIHKTTEGTLEEIKGLREDVQPGSGMNFRQVQTDVRAVKERLGML
jgi:methyl-accepting chemotaxis protein